MILANGTTAPAIKLNTLQFLHFSSTNEFKNETMADIFPIVTDKADNTDKKLIGFNGKTDSLSVIDKRFIGKID